MASLEERTQRLEDIGAVRRVLLRLGESCDGPYDADTFVSLMTEDAIMDLMEMGVYRGRQAIHDFIAGLREHISFTLHYWCGFLIDIAPSGTEATATWYGMETPTIEGRAVLGGLTHDARLRKVEGRWMLTHLGQHLHFLTPYDKGWVKERTIPPIGS